MARMDIVDRVPSVEPIERVVIALLVVGTLVGVCFTHSFGPKRLRKALDDNFGIYWRFAYSCFFKPHEKRGSRNQQDALESFYRAQAGVYDATRVRLLQGREEMLAMSAAQVKQRVESGVISPRPVWVDVGGGTGYNIEKMGESLDVPNFFSQVYLVDFSPSLCEVARERFQRLGWKNVKVVCEDARHFRLEDHEAPAGTVARRSSTGRHKLTAELLTMSYSLSMIPEFYPVVDSLSSLLAPNGVIGVADFYVQSEVDYQSRNYTGGEMDRHCMWISRVFWRTWFEQDRVSLEAARRDYLEYRFGTILQFNGRCRMLGLRIPYYVWVGCSKDDGSSQHKLAQLNAAVTESPFLSALDTRQAPGGVTDVRSKAYESAVVNLAASLPLPAAWYQTHHWRIYYDEQLQKHRQFNDEYIYAFTWEDARVDARLLNIGSDDVVLAITSAGDNILAYALERPKRIHAIDLNPSQNHLLELKLAAFTALDQDDVWALFGEGKHPGFRQLLISRLSPHLSSAAFQFWLRVGEKTFSPAGNGLYWTGGSRHALKLARWLFGITNIRGDVARLVEAKTLNEQREIWQRSIRRVLLSQLLSWGIVSSKAWLWKALGVPPAQRQMIEDDFAHATKNTASNFTTGQAIWKYAVDTLDPMVNDTLIGQDNHYYLLCLLGHYTRRCHPEYLSGKAHAKLSRPGAFDGLRIHTDDICEVVERMTPGTLTVAVVMDSMDWFHPTDGIEQVRKQVALLKRSLKVGGRVMLRSAGRHPWYISVFEDEGFKARRAADREPGTCIDRVNMYASTWICTKLDAHGRSASLDDISIGEAAQPE